MTIWCTVKAVWFYYTSQQNSYSISYLLGTVTTQWLDSDSVVPVDNCRQHGDFVYLQHCHCPVIVKSLCLVGKWQNSSFAVYDLFPPVQQNPCDLYRPADLWCYMQFGWQQLLVFAPAVCVRAPWFTQGLCFFKLLRPFILYKKLIEQCILFNEFLVLYEGSQEFKKYTFKQIDRPIPCLCCQTKRSTGLLDCSFLELLCRYFKVEMPVQ